MKSKLPSLRTARASARALAGAILSTLALLAPAFAAKPAGFADWSIKGAYSDNGARGEIILNGSWRWQPFIKGQNAPDAGKWLFRNVPGWRRTEFFIRDASGRVVTTWQGKRVTGEERCWQEREFTVPSRWRGRKIALEFYCTLDESEVFLDGKKLGRIPKLTGRNFALPEPVKFDAPYRLTVLTSGVTDDVWLRSYPKGARIEDDYLVTSVRNMELRLQARGTGAAARRLRLSVAEDEGFKQKVKEAEFGKLRTAPGGLWSVDASAPWKNPKLWSVEHPNLYWYAVELFDSDGKVLDATLPRRFGFREFRIEDGTFLLNEKPFHYYGYQIPAFKFTSSFNNRLAGKTKRFVADLVRQCKLLGFNGCCMWGFGETAGGPVFETFDEMGFVTFPTLPSYRRYEAKPYPDKRARWEARLAPILRRYRRHPSIVMWDVPGGSHIWDYCPATLDGSRDPEKDWPEQMEGIRFRFREVRDFILRFDTTRPIIQHSSEMKDNPVVSTMGYLGFDFDLQERENWPLAWSKVRHKPLFNMEFGLPIHRNYEMRKPRHKSIGRKHFEMEYSAMYFGEKFYRETPDEWLPFMASDGPRPPRARHYYSPPLMKMKELFTKNTFLAWRTYGVNLGPWGEQRLWWEPGSFIQYHSRGEDPRRAGATPDQWLHINSSLGTKLNFLGKTAQAALRPLCVFIGGSPLFTRKDHCFTSGDEVTKTVVVINDTEDDLTLEGAWQLVDAAGKSVAGGEIKGVAVKAGFRSTNDVKMVFKAPAVSKRQAFTLTLAMRAPRPGTLKDRMTIHVFPKPAGGPGKLAPRVYCFDPVGDTRAMLKKAGVKYLPLRSVARLKNKDALLVIGRRCLEKPANVKKLGTAFDEAVASGLRVLVFEQAAENVLGLKLQETSPRYTFIRAEGHPAFKGLEASDFIYWSGESDLVKPYADPLDPFGGKLPPSRGGHKGYPLRLWRWGNDNCVATYVIEKPQLGACRALVDCGFDLLETPLLEVVRGKGRMIFCQLDVTNRYGVDPVATRLTDNLLAYLASARPPRPNVGEPVDLAKRRSPSAALTSFTGYRAAVPEGPLGWGISAADVYFREKPTLKALKTKSGDVALFTRLKQKGKRAAYTLQPNALKTGWGKSKAMRAIAALRINQGGSSDDGPRVSLHGDAKALYPVEWLEGFVHPYTHWRW